MSIANKSGFSRNEAVRCTMHMLFSTIYYDDFSRDEFNIRERGYMRRETFRKNNWVINGKSSIL